MITSSMNSIKEKIQGTSAKPERKAGTADRDGMQGANRSRSLSYGEDLQHSRPPETADARGAAGFSEVPQDVRPLLIELLCEELPPKALQALGLAFARAVRDGLAGHGLLSDDDALQDFATPRRLAVRVTRVAAQAQPRPFTEKLMPVAVGLTDGGGFTPALVKKLAAKGLSHLTPADLTRTFDGKQDVLTAQGVADGAMLVDTLQGVLDQAIASLPIPKVMRYQLADGCSSVKFVRPVHALTVLWGDAVIPVTALGLTADRTTQGHRFLGAQRIVVRDANTYEQQLFDEGKVVASLAQRRQSILDQLERQAQALDASLGVQDEVDALLDEVTALVELPAVYVGQFDPAFLDVPPECLILTMRLNQKYFPLFDANTGALTHRFLIVSNMRIDDPANIIEGNERVVRPRLADAQFFYQTDRKTPLAARVDSLQTRIYHHKLGSQYERVERVRALARHIAGQLGDMAGGDGARLEALADRAAFLAKADLNTLMVGEFPQLQGVIGAYYAQADGEDAAVVQAIRDQYHHRLEVPMALDQPESWVRAILFMAERLETLVGIWGIGLAPTGERDPYGLRRAALGLISAYAQLQAAGILPLESRALDVGALLRFTQGVFAANTLAQDTAAEVHAFLFERYRNLLAASHDRHLVDAVLAVNPPLHQVLARLSACAAFAQLPQSANLAAANKRIGNLLKKSGDEAAAQVDARLLAEPAEQALAAALQGAAPVAQRQFDAGDFADSLTTLAQLGGHVDDFFTQVMVMADDPKLRVNRLALLTGLHRLMNQVADLARLAA